MNDDAEQQLSAGSYPTASYPQGLLAQALLTSLPHGDAETRRRADRWHAGMADGRLTIGSRTPVAGLPAWVTPEVIRGGFATSAARAEGPLQPYEREAASLAGLPAERRALFTHCLTEPGSLPADAAAPTARPGPPRSSRQPPTPPSTTNSAAPSHRPPRSVRSPATARPHRPVAATTSFVFPAVGLQQVDGLLLGVRHRPRRTPGSSHPHGLLRHRPPARAGPPGRRRPQARR